MKSLEELAGVERSYRAAHFHSLVRHLMRGYGSADEAAQLAQASRAPKEVIECLKSAVGAGGGSEWGSEIPGYSTLASAFQDQLRNSSLFFAMLNSMIRVPFATRLGEILTSASASIVQAGAAVPVSKLNTAAQFVDRRKAAGLVVLSEQLLNSGTAAEGLIGRSLQASVSEATDREFITILTTGVTPITSVGAPLADLRALLSAVGLTAQSRPFWATSVDTGIQLATVGDAPLGGSPDVPAGARMFPSVSATGVSTLLDIPLVVTAGLTSGLMLVDAAKIAAASETIQLEVSRQAALQLDSAPTMQAMAAGSPDAPSPAQVTSMWQTNSVAARALQYFGATVLSGTPVAVLDAISW